ncbi:MAG: hypothetical protein EP329_08045 [Deltaproteobacteria bacterium]|nr:MAG: hypothetical protein EP329_08045 [Deltaproteobacteria bacterium]
MTHPTLLVWEGHWSLASDFHIRARVYGAAAGGYDLVLDYPPIGVAGAPGHGFTLVAGRGMSWAEVRSYLTRCDMVTGWTPTPPPASAPASFPHADDGARPRGGRTLFRSRGRLSSPDTRRVSPRLVEARRRTRPGARSGRPDLPEVA